MFSQCQNEKILHACVLDRVKQPLIHNKLVILDVLHQALKTLGPCLELHDLKTEFFVFQNLVPLPVVQKWAKNGFSQISSGYTPFWGVFEEISTYLKLLVYGVTTPTVCE